MSAKCKTICAWGSLFTAYSELGAHEPCQNGGTFSGDSINYKGL